MGTRLTPHPLFQPAKPFSQPFSLPSWLESNSILDLLPIHSSKWLDRSGNGNHGTNHGATLVSTGRYGFGFEFDGVDDYIDCGNDSSLTPALSLSCAVWFYVLNWVTNDGIVTRMTGSHTHNWNLYLYEGKELGCLIGTGSGYDRITSSVGNLDVNQWIHAVYTYDGTSRLFINGSIQDNISTSTMSRLESTPLNIGIKYTSGASPYRGIIDQVTLYPFALNSSDVELLYNLGKP